MQQGNTGERDGGGGWEGTWGERGWVELGVAIVAVGSSRSQAPAVVQW